MTSSSKVSTAAVANALETLTEDETKELFIHLQVPLHSIKNISKHQSVNMCKIEYIQLWIDCDLEASWERIVWGLRQISKKALAKRLALLYCGTSLSEKEEPPPNDSHPDPAAGHPLSPLPSPPTPPTPPRVPPLPPSLPPTPPSLADRVTKTIAEIDKLCDNFTSIMSSTRDELCQKESSDSSFLDWFRDSLMDLPIVKKAPHNKFFTKSEDDLLMAKTMHKLFAILRRYCSYRNYEVLKEVVRKFCKAVLKQRMEEYCVSLENFEKVTTVNVYLIAENAGDVLRSEFERLTMKINKPPSECTLYEIRKVTRSMEEKASLHLYSVYIGSPSEGSVQVELGIHPDCVGRILAVLDPQFLQSHHLSDVCLGRRHQQLVMWRNVPQQELNRQLLSANESGDLMAVTSLLNSGANVQTKTMDRYAETPLFKASKRGDLQMVNLLTGRGSKVDSKDRTGETPIMIAALAGQYKIVMEFLSLDADVNAQDKGGWSALIWAASKGHTKVVMELVKAGANLDQQNNNGFSALMLAAHNGKTDTVIQLVKLGANLNLQDKDGDSAVIKAITSYLSNPQVVKELVRGKSNLNIQNQEGLTALMIAIRSERSSELVHVLLEGGEGIIDVDIQQYETGWSALFFSVESGNAAITQTLIAAGADPNLKDKNGLTAYDIASASDKDTSEEICQLLAEASITPSCPPDSPAPTTSLLQLDSPASDQDTSSPKRDSPRKDTTVTEPDVLDTTPITSGQRRQRRNISETIRNLANKSRKVALNIFVRLDRRLKSTDKKKQISSSSQPEPDKEAKIEKIDKGPQSYIPTLTTSIK